MIVKNHAWRNFQSDPAIIFSCLFERQFKAFNCALLWLVPFFRSCLRVDCVETKFSRRVSPAKSHRVKVKRSETKLNQHTRSARQSRAKYQSDYWNSFSTTHCLIMRRWIPCYVSLTQFQSARSLAEWLTSRKFLHYLHRSLKCVFINYRDLFSKHCKSISKYRSGEIFVSCMYEKNIYARYRIQRFSRSIGADYVNWFAFRAIVCGRIKRQLIRLFHVNEHKIRHFRFNFFVRYQQSGRIVAMNGRVIGKFSLNESWFTFRCILFSRNEIGNEWLRLSKRMDFWFYEMVQPLRRDCMLISLTVVPSIDLTFARFAAFLAAFLADGHKYSMLRWTRTPCS